LGRRLVGERERAHPCTHTPSLTPHKKNTDTLTIQAASLKEHCTPNPALGVGCDLGIAVYAWSNTSYSLLAMLNRGWASPVQLTPGRPQAGRVEKGVYSYYSVRLPGPGGEEQQPVVRITLLPEGDGDQDL
jgi:hypothetical protein